MTTEAETAALVSVESEAVPPAQQGPAVQRLPSSSSMSKTRSVMVHASSGERLGGRRTLWIQGMQLLDDANAMNRLLKNSLEAVLGKGSVEKVTVRRKAESESTSGKRSEHLSWALVSFASSAMAREALRAHEERRFGDAFENIALQESGRIISADAQAARLFHTYGDPEMQDLTFDRFQRLMVTEFEAESKAIQTLWNLPGFTHRQANLERLEVVSLHNFREHMEKLQLMRLLGCPETGEASPFPPNVEPEVQLTRCQKCCFQMCLCRRCCVGADGNVRVDPESHHCLKGRQVFEVLSIWDTLVTLLLLWVTATVPVRIGFNLLSEAWSVWFICDLAADACFAVDIFLNLSMAINIDGIENRWERNANAVHKQYMFNDNAWHGAGLFWIDLLSCMPVSYIQYFFGSGTNSQDQKLFRMVRLLRLAKLIRLLKIRSVLKRNTESLRNADFVGVIKSGVGILLGAHLLACSWHFIAIAGCDVHTEECIPGQDTWIDQYDPQLLNQTLWHRYVASLYFAISTVSTVGYGDILPSNTAERCFVILCQMIGVVAFGYAMGALSAYVVESDKDARLEHYNSIMPRVDSYLELKKIPKRRREEIKQRLGHVVMHSPEYSVDKEDDVLEQMRSIDAVVAHQTVVDVYYKLSVPKLFRVYEPGSEEIVDLGHLLEPIYNKDGERDFEAVSVDEYGNCNTEQGEMIIEEGQVVQGIYVIEKGRCKVTVRGQDDHDAPELLGEGDCFGEIAAMGFGGGRDGRENTRTVRAATEAQKLHRAFQRIDLDGSGTISRAELKQGVRFLGIDPTEEELSAIMSSLDANEDDSIDFAEFQEFFQQKYPETEKVQLKFLPLEKLHQLFRKYPSMESTLWMQVSLRHTKDINEQKRRRLEKLQFPQNQEQCDALFDKIYANPENRGTGSKVPVAHDSQQVDQETVSFDALLLELEQFAENLPISPELPYDERERMIKETFDQDGSDSIDRAELWAGIQDFMNNPSRFRPPIRSTEQSMSALVSEHMHAMEERLAASLDTRLVQVENTQAQILELLKAVQQQGLR